MEKQMNAVFKEVLHIGLRQEVTVNKVLIDKKSKYQRIQILDTSVYGRILVLDGIIQVTEKDEAAYSEMLVHPAIQVLKNPQNVLIIGGGDGAVAEEILKYNFVKIPTNISAVKILLDNEDSEIILESIIFLNTEFDKLLLLFI